jgi:ATP-dependent DNA ligase
MITKDNFMLCEGIVEDVLKESINNYSGWIAEYKEDGERIIAVVIDGEAILVNRNGKICNFHFKEVVEGLKGLPNVILDGEIISKDGDFNKLLQRALTKTPSKIKQLEKDVPVDYVIFDILKIGDVDLRQKSLLERKEQLHKLFETQDTQRTNPNTNIKLIEYGDINEMLEKAHKLDKEGIIIKRLNSSYEGRRSSEWKKCKFFCEATITITKYEINPKGITGEDDKGNRVAILGEQSQEVKYLLDTNGSVEITIQFLEITDEGKYRFPSYRGLKPIN